MEKGLPKLYKCRNKGEEVCRKVIPCGEIPIDPRSYCHNILSKPSKICKKIACRKFFKRNIEKTKGEVVCVTRAPCKMIRRFGPFMDEPLDEDEKFFRMFGSKLGLILDEGTVSETDILKGKIGKDPIDHSKGGNVKFTKYGLVQDEETAKFLEDLSKYLDPEAMGALSAMCGAEICPCCKCAICKCRLRGVESEMNLTKRRQAMIEKRLMDWGKSGYAWTFDYFYNPDFNYFENERKKRLQELMEDELAGLAQLEEYIEEEEEKKEDMMDFVDYGSIPTEASSEGKVSDETESTEMDLVALEHLPRYSRQTSRSSIESWVEERKSYAASARLSILTGASMQPLEETFPFVEVKGPVRLIEEASPRVSIASSGPRADSIDQHPPSIRSQKSEKERSSVVQHRPSIRSRKSESRGESYVQHRPSFKLKESESGKSDASKLLETVIPEFPSVPEKRRSTVKGRVSIQVTKPEVDDEDETVPEEYERKSTYSSRYDERRSFRSYRRSTISTIDPCDCLPGFCTCGTWHHTFTKLNLDEMAKELSTKKDDVNIVEEVIDVKSSTHSSCICIHPWDDLDDSLFNVTPSLSSKEIHRKVKLPLKLIPCTEPKYQNTVVIVKPEATGYKDVILRKIKREGFDIIDERFIQLTPEQVAEIYSENYGSSYFAIFVQRMSSTPILVLNVAGMNVIARWKKIIGEGEGINASWFYPESIKRRFGVFHDIHGAMKVSNDYKTSKNEIRYFFPLDILEPIMIESQAIQDYCDKNIHPTLLKSLMKLIIEQPTDPIVFLAKQILMNNPFQPSYSDSKVALANT